MRVTRIPGDANDIGDRPCRVYLNQVEIHNWIVADDFRRVIETSNDTTHFGSVRIDMQPQASEPTEAVTHLGGMFVVEPKPEAPAIEIVEAQPEPAPMAPNAPAQKGNRRRK